MPAGLRALAFLPVPCLDRGNSRMARQASSKLDSGSSSAVTIGFEAEEERKMSVADELEAVGTTHLQRATRLRRSILQNAATREL